MKLLTVGSGPHYANGWINLDLNTHPDWEPANGGKGQPDILASVFDMPFENEEIDRVYLGHILEHLEYDKIPDALREVKRVTKPGGEIMVVGPCHDKAKRLNVPDDLMHAIEAHGFDGTGFGHEWTPTTKLTLEAVQIVFPKAQVVNITDVTKPKWPNPSQAGWQCAVQAFA
jgi:SAM-dependent methyltransferase